METGIEENPDSGFDLESDSSIEIFSEIFLKGCLTGLLVLPYTLLTTLFRGHHHISREQARNHVNDTLLSKIKNSGGEVPKKSCFYHSIQEMIGSCEKCRKRYEGVYAEFENGRFLK